MTSICTMSLTEENELKTCAFTARLESAKFKTDAIRAELTILDENGKDTGAGYVCFDIPKEVRISPARFRITIERVA